MDVGEGGHSWLGEQRQQGHRDYDIAMRGLECRGYFTWVRDGELYMPY